MSKQIKLGFDKVPSPSAIQFVPLYDIATGIPLRDISQQIIVTQIEGSLDVFFLSDNSTSVVVNQDRIAGSIPIQEQFPLESEVSSTLLGVPRAEEQLSLFSDVSTYGLDDDNWEYFTFDGVFRVPEQWYSRRNTVYGNRQGVKFYEGTNEQALYLKAYPVNWTFPFGPGWERSGRYNENIYRQYLNFIVLGKVFYKYYTNPEFLGIYDFFAESNFIPDFIKVVNSAGIEIEDLDVTYGGPGFTSFASGSSYYDVDYGDDLNKAFEQIEKWTVAFQDLLNESLPDPRSVTGPGAPLYQLDLTRAANDAESNGQIRPGASSGGIYTGILQSRETFRYQPGRISGFTYGIRLRNDPRSNGNFIEFGCTNDTDHYVFQIRGSQFNIVRRSTIKFDDDLLRRQGLTPDFQTATPVYPLGGFAPIPLYETVIPRDNFNGDSLDGNGPSRYIISFEDVTMFKIEFGWYGAIGAKFYAYVPFGNDGARWVLIHTLVIENGMSEPCLQNPNFRFRYLLGVTDTTTLREPIYVYKYGASYYIDGGDEGTKKVLSGSSSPKQFIDFTPNIGIFPKSVMINQLGEEILNRKQVYPTTLSVNSTEPSRVNVLEIQGSPEGHHYHYSPSLHNGRNKETREIDIIISEDGQRVLTDNGVLTPEDEGKKIVADGLYNVYIGEPNEAGSSAPILRRSEYNLTSGSMSELVRLYSTSESVEPRARAFAGVKLTGPTKVVASNIGVTGNTMKIHFLNPVARDSDTGRHFADFRVGVTPLKPTLGSIEIVIDEEQQTTETVPEILFGEGENQRLLTPNDPEFLSVDWSAYQEQNDLDGVEIQEWDPTYGIKFDIDPRLPRPLGEDSGVISCVVMSILTVPYIVSKVETVGDEIRLFVNGGSLGTAPRIGAQSVGIAEIGINNLPSGIKILSEPVQTTTNEEYVLVDSDPTQHPNYNENDPRIQLRSIRLTDNFQVESFDDDGVPLFDYKSVIAERTLQYNIKPLYPVFMMNDGARINNIVIEEITTETNYSHTPNWLSVPDSDTTGDGNFDNNVIELSGGSSLLNAPANFVSVDRLSSVRLDTQTQQPLRPGTSIYSLFVDGGSTERIDLSNIFNYDRKTIATGLYNNRATFFTSTPLDNNFIGDSEISLTLEEQN